MTFFVQQKYTERCILVTNTFYTYNDIFYCFSSLTDYHCELTVNFPICGREKFNSGTVTH